MNKNILLITGSPRKYGNTDRMADAFEKGANCAGHSVHRINARELNLRGCADCTACFQNGENSACSIEPDFNEIVPYFLSCDTIVFCTPLYWYSFPAQLKAVIDKIYAFVVSKRTSNIKNSYLFVCGECSETRYFEGVIRSYELLAEDRKWNDLGHYIAHGVVAPGDIDESIHIEEIEKIGRQL